MTPDERFLKAMRIQPWQIEPAARAPQRAEDPDIGRRDVSIYIDEDGDVCLSREDFDWLTRSNRLLDERLNAAREKAREAKRERYGRDFWMVILGAVIAFVFVVVSRG